MKTKTFISNVSVGLLIFILSSASLNGITKAQTPTETPTVTQTETPTPTPTRTPVIQTPVTPVPCYLQWPRSDTTPNAGFVNSTFGEYRSTHFHAGIDIPGGNDAFALATVDGIVIDRDYYETAGNVVSLLDSNGYVVNYLHLSDHGFTTDFPPINSTVSEGTPIGRVGNTGGSYPYHLHLELRSILPTPGPNYRSRADAYNPLSWLDPPWTPTPTSGNRPPFLMNLYVVPEGSGSYLRSS